jgi:hypothetical protein
MGKGGNVVIRTSVGFEDVEGTCSDPENNKKTHTGARLKTLRTISCVQEVRFVSLNKSELVPQALDLTGVGEDHELYS